jgi:hypothetical protein
VTFTGNGYDVADKEDFVEMSTQNKQLTIRLRAVPLPQPLKQFLEEAANQQIIKKMLDTANDDDDEEAPKDNLGKLAKLVKSARS